MEHLKVAASVINLAIGISFSVSVQRRFSTPVIPDGLRERPKRRRGTSDAGPASSGGGG